ncbi:MAG: glycosyltransferase family 4 protein [Chloroflexaceae bacterium]|nr:glycosyltransferase family 4 protein [Chloroflexaceae bacterium]
MHILLPSDVFPPGSVGGAAWSAYTLAHALQADYHTVTAVVPVPQGTQPPQSETQIPTVYHPYRAPAIPFVQNYYRHERLWQPLAHTLIDLARTAPTRDLLIHAQHVQTMPAAVLAGRKLGIPVVVTVRDHWPHDYFATGLHANRLPYMLRSGWWQRAAALLTDLPVRLGPVRGVLAWAAVPYMLAHLRRRALFLAQADAVIAVSAYMARRLAGIVPAERLHVIPNMVDLPLVEQLAATPLDHSLPPSFLLYVGKLEQNKGAGLLPAIFRELQRQLAALPPEQRPALPTLVVAGSGALRPALEHELVGLGIPVQFLSWVSHDEIVRLLARCTLLLFPSVWGEPLSRVLLEATAAGAPVVAMPTGGTPEIITHGKNGLLAATEAAFAGRVLSLLRDPARRLHLSDGAREVARQRFAVEAVLPQVEGVYQRLGHQVRGGGSPGD